MEKRFRDLIKLRYQSIQSKISHRAFITPVRMKEMDPSGASNLCWPGCGQVLIHMLHCPEVISFWEDVVP